MSGVAARANSAVIDIMRMCVSKRCGEWRI
jgi:hypothetical protein